MTTLDYLPVLDLANTLFARKFDPEIDSSVLDAIDVLRSQDVEPKAVPPFMKAVSHPNPTTHAAIQVLSLRWGCLNWFLFVWSNFSFVCLCVCCLVFVLPLPNTPSSTQFFFRWLCECLLLSPWRRRRQENLTTTILATTTLAKSKRTRRRRRTIAWT